MLRQLKDIFFKKLGRKQKDPLNIHVMGKLSYIMLGKSIPLKYKDPWNPIMTIQINGVDIPNVLEYIWGID